MASVPIFDSFVQFVMDNLLFVGIFCVGGYLLYENFNLKKKSSYKIIDRADVERKLFIKRMKFNVASKYKWLYKGFTRYKVHDQMLGEHFEFKPGKLLGKIKYYMETKSPKYTLKMNKDKEIVQVPVKGEMIDLISMVVQPCLLGGILTNPLAKPHVIVLQNDGDLVKAGSKIMVSQSVGISNYVGIYHSIGKEETSITANIRDSDLFKSDLNNMASVYFAKSQEQSTFDPAYAHALALEQRKLEVELAKKKGKAESI